MVRTGGDGRRAIWLGDSIDAVKSFPEDVQDDLGHVLGIVQRGGMPASAEPLTQLSNKVIELKDDYEGDTYRVFCAIGLRKGIYVLDAFKKKSRKGSRYSNEEIGRIGKRFEQAKRMDEAKAPATGKKERLP